MPNKLVLDINENVYINTLEIESFPGMLANNDTCYKFYWLEALVELISNNKEFETITLDEIFDEMIANAWYTVVEFHIHLSGLKENEYKDALECAVKRLKEVSGLEGNVDKEKIKNAIKDFNREIHPFKQRLTTNVPYRALRPFIKDEKGFPGWETQSNVVRFIEEVNGYKILPYTLGNERGVDKKVYINPIWKRVIKDNTAQILGWIQYNKIQWLQNKNPEVPSIVYKLKPLGENRDLGKVRELWKAVFEVTPIIDIFTENPLNNKKFDVDHFIPWSFVMNNELWNLMPMDSNLNSSKSNLLPSWNKYFKAFAQNQYKMFEKVNEYEGIRALYENCYSDHIHSIWAIKDLYIEDNSEEKFRNVLKRNMKPVYDSAKRQGYQMWKNEGGRP